MEEFEEILKRIRESLDGTVQIEIVHEIIEED